jgi:peptidoglycan/xylan/chitin deacetylase (PgdA/CDA1 family)
MITTPNATEITKRFINKLVYLTKKKQQIDGARILMYHSIGDQAYGDVYNNYNLGPAEFDRHLHFFKEYYSSDFHSLDTLETENKSGIYLTFDDGYLNNLKIAAPLLLKFNIPATVFVCTGFLDNKSCNFLRLGDLKELSEYPNITIGSHTVTHAKLNRLSGKIQRRELSQSKNFLQDALDTEIRYLSYPNGLFNDQSMEIAAEVGYKLAFCSRIGAYKDCNKRFSIPRCDVRSSFNCGDLEHQLTGAADWQKILKR